MRVCHLALVAALAGCQPPAHHDLGPRVSAPGSGSTGCGSNNGVWPMITNFNFNLTDNNSGGTPNAVGYDSLDGPPCTGGTSSASLTWASGASCYAHFVYNVVLNAPCGYQYASLSFPMAAPRNDWTGKTGLSFKVKSDVPGRLFRISMRTAAADACLGPGAKNKRWYDYTTTTNAWENVSLSFSAFTLANAGCPYPVTDVPSLVFAVETAGQGGTFDFDDIQLLP